MSDLRTRVDNLSPAKRKLLERMSARESSQPRTYPLSCAQQRMCFIDQLEPMSALYNMAFAMRLSGPLDKRALRRSLQEIVRRHEALRTRFPQRGGVLVQEVAQDCEVDVPEVDLGDLPEQDREHEAARRVKADAARPFDLAGGGLVRATLFRLSDDDSVLLVNMHHIVSDGWSCGIFEDELNQLYAAYRLGLPSPLPELAVQYGDFAVWQRRMAAGRGAAASSSAYWKDQLQDVAAAGAARPTGRARRCELPRRDTVGVSALPTRCSLQAQAALPAREARRRSWCCSPAFQALLRRYGGQDDVLVGHAHRRPQPARRRRG